MQTKFLLNGGNLSLNDITSFRFWRNAINDLDDDIVLVTSIPFAANAANMVSTSRLWEDARVYVQAVLEFVNPHKEFIVDSPDMRDDGGNMTTLIEDADVIFVHGGDGDLLQKYMSRLCPDIANLVKSDKVIIGTSAGANMWATKYYSNDNRKVCDGLGVLPVATFCHYTAEKYDKLNTLKVEAAGLDIIPLREDENVCIYI